MCSKLLDAFACKLCLHATVRGRSHMGTCIVCMATESALDGDE